MDVDGYWGEGNISDPLHTLCTGIQGQTGTPVHKFLKFVLPDALEMPSLALSVLRFLCKTFSKLLKFTLQNTLVHG